jgi:putative heme-binding domain-containing protein
MPSKSFVPHCRQAQRQVSLVFAILVSIAAGPGGGSPRFTLPPGFTIEKVAGPPLVKYPLFASLDDRGRLFVAEGTGTNHPGSELEKLKLGRILMLEDKDGDGRFDTSQVFADGLIFPTGVQPHGRSLFATSHPSLWRFDDVDGDGKADRRSEVVTKFHFNGNGCDIHGPFAGPDGFLYWTDGRHGYDVQTREGTRLKGLASRIWRCRPDGTAVERLAGGGFDNPVELAFTEEGDMIGTMDQGPGDALLHYVEGGVYPMDHPAVSEFPMTGPMLGSVAQFSAALPVALCGLMRYRSSQFGAEYQDSLFTAQFNVHRVQQHTLVRDGSTFTAVNKDFLTSTDYDVHPTDVLEDADGSLLVVDMGAWFNFGCPTSKIAKPEVLGAIYRIRRTDAAPVKDPWGRSLAMDKLKPEELTRFLDDPRPKVRDAAMDELVSKGWPSVAAMFGSEGRGARSAMAERNRLWVFARVSLNEPDPPRPTAAERREADSPPSDPHERPVETSRELANRRIEMLSLVSPDPSVRAVGVYTAGLRRSPRATSSLLRIVVDDSPALRLKAAESLGRIGKPDAIPALLTSLRKGDADRFLEHALIYALVRINNPEATRVALTDASPRVRRAGLIALDQMADRRLTQEQVLPLLDTDDPELQQAAVAVVSREGTWSDQVLRRLREWLSAAALTPSQERSLTGALLALSRRTEAQRLVTEALKDPGTSPERRALLLAVIARSRLDHLPADWLEVLGAALDQANDRVRAEAVATIRARNLGGFEQRLDALGRDVRMPAELRVAALDCVAARHARLSPEGFSLLVSHLKSESEPLLQVAAARALGAAALDDAQRTTLAGSLPGAGPLLVPLLLPAFAQSSRADLGRAVIAGLKQSPGASALSADDLDGLLRNYPPAVRTAAQPLLERVAARRDEQAKYLGELTSRLASTPGSPDRGRAVFLSRKVGCSACHTIDGQGGIVGPDLSRIGAVRTTRDLLEAVVYPSSTVVPAFRSYLIATRDGRVTHGMVVRETSDALFVRSADLAEVRIPVKDVEALRPSDHSLMPQGLEKTMSTQELSDLLEFLYRRR